MNSSSSDLEKRILSGIVTVVHLPFTIPREISYLFFKAKINLRQKVFLFKEICSKKWIYNTAVFEDDETNVYIPLFYTGDLGFQTYLGLERPTAKAVISLNQHNIKTSSSGFHSQSDDYQWAILSDTPLPDWVVEKAINCGLTYKIRRLTIPSTDGQEFSYDLNFDGKLLDFVLAESIFNEFAETLGFDWNITQHKSLAKLKNNILEKRWKNLPHCKIITKEETQILLESGDHDYYRKVVRNKSI